MNGQTQRMMGVLTATALAAAMTVSAAQARPDDRGGLLGVGGATLVQNNRPDDRPGALGVGGASPAVQVEQQAAVRPDDRGGLRGPGTTPTPVTLSYQALDDGGFEWGSEEIATGVALLMALLAGATLLASHRRERQLRY